MDYLGHTVNFKTHVKSYKHYKTIHNSPDKWKIFEDTHEAIIDKETFEIVQKIRAGKRRPTKMGEMPMFSGLLYCADCGSKLTFHRKADELAEKHNYVCGNYRGNTSNCTIHYIRNVVVERIVLENLKEVIHFVSNYEDEFVRMVMDADVRQKNRELAQKKKRLAELQKRIGELDTIFQRIYEDNIVGKLSDERFMKMSKGYEEEQRTLQAEADTIWASSSPFCASLKMRAECSTFSCFALCSAESGWASSMESACSISPPPEAIGSSLP